MSVPTVGDMTCTGAVESSATTVTEVIGGQRDPDLAEWRRIRRVRSSDISVMRKPLTSLGRHRSV